MKDYIVIAQLYWSADHIEEFKVRCNTKRKAKILAERLIKNKYSNIGDMIRILDIKQAVQ